MMKVDFARGAWRPEDWKVVKSSRWEYANGFVQEADHLVNPSGPWDDATLYRDHVTEVYASMIYTRKLSGKCRVSSTMSFDHLMAPLIVLAPELGTSVDGCFPEYRRHHEVVLYNEGINVWRYDWIGGKLKWTLAAFLRVPFEAKRRYELSVTVEAYKDTRRLTVSCGGHTFGYSDDSLALDYWAGITGCEGRNRFYDFTVDENLAAHDDASDGEH